MDFNKSDYHITEDELIELEKRWKKYKENPTAVKTWEEVKANILTVLTNTF